MKWWQFAFLALCALLSCGALISVPWLHQSGQNFAAFAFAGMAVCLVGLGWNLFVQWRKQATPTNEASRR